MSNKAPSPEKSGFERATDAALSLFVGLLALKGAGDILRIQR